MSRILIQRGRELTDCVSGLCALALVFAIQRCDPAPFYLFDEIDANLDAQYRTAVAQMLQSISSGKCARARAELYRRSLTDGNARSAESTDEGGGQFICTTFRPEMLMVAQKCYGVTYEHKSSKVLAVSRDEAMEFVQGEATK